MGNEIKDEKREDSMFCNSHPSLRNWVLCFPSPAEQRSSSHITEMANRGPESLGNCSGSHSKLEAEPGKTCPPSPRKPHYLPSQVCLVRLQELLSTIPWRTEWYAASKMAPMSLTSWIMP